MTTALFILGMHRSGTSALARVVNLLGAELGSHLMQAAEDNQKGFFEHEEVVSIHESLLAELGLSWQDGIPLPEGWQQSDAAKKAALALGAIIDRDFADCSLWALKDPRQCRLMPLWMPLLAERNINPAFILAWRHPLEVAASLHRRDDMPEEAALYAWLGYTVEAFLAAQDHPFSIVSYDELLNSWQQVMKRVEAELNLPWPIATEKAAAEIDQFLSPSLRHHEAEEKALPKAIEDCLKLLQKPNKKALEKLHTQWQDEHAALAPLLREARLSGFYLAKELEKTKREAASASHRADDLEKQFAAQAQMLSQLEQHLQSIQEEAAQREALLKQQLERVYASTSWKVTQPLRTLGSTVSGGKKLEKQDDNS